MSRRIAIFKENLKGGGGLEKYTWKIAEKFSHLGDSVTFLTPSKTLNSEIPYHVEKCYTWNFPPSTKLEQFNQAVDSWVEKNKPDITFGMDRTRHQDYFRAGNGCHKAYLEQRKNSEGFLKYVLCKYNPMHRKILEIEKATFESSSIKKIFTNSHFVKKQILTYYEPKDNAIEVIHNGVEWVDLQKEFDHALSHKAEIFRAFEANPDHLQFLFVGSGYFRKGLHKLLQSLFALPRRDFMLHVVGKDKNILYFQKLAHKLGLQNNVHFWGGQHSVTKFYQLADCLVIPSFYDPFANVTIEALAMGLFVISSQTNGGSEVMNSESGICFSLSPQNEELIFALSCAFNFPKKHSLSYKIRESVKHLDFSNQLQKLILLCV